ncbi:hypothetical protein RRG08_055081 [Elysia crispata]|uniref:Uncharacterized protein n=1 Tax=Elysia crispata TaxID=231223 RepID=A0AAE1E835_9GAST|nr:hypothetical protein RRG08_055081 [Elysia crispata]
MLLDRTIVLFFHYTVGNNTIPRKFPYAKSDSVLHDNNASWFLWISRPLCGRTAISWTTDIYRSRSFTEAKELSVLKQSPDCSVLFSHGVFSSSQGEEFPRQLDMATHRAGR